MYYVRKLSKPNNYEKVKLAESIEDINSDVLKQELSTTFDTLSFWKCNDLDNMDDTIKAILLSTNKIDKSKFIVLDSELVKKYDLDVEESIGKTGYKGFENLHIDISNLTYKKIGEILKAYKESFEEDMYQKELSKTEIKELIKEVNEEQKIDFDNIDDHLKKDIMKILNPSN